MGTELLTDRLALGLEMALRAGFVGFIGAYPALSILRHVLGDAARERTRWLSIKIVLAVALVTFVLAFTISPLTELFLSIIGYFALAAVAASTCALVILAIVWLGKKVRGSK